MGGEVCSCGSMCFSTLRSSDSSLKYRYSYSRHEGFLNEGPALEACAAKLDAMAGSTHLERCSNEAWKMGNATQTFKSSRIEFSPAIGVKMFFGASGGVKAWLTS